MNFRCLMWCPKSSFKKCNDAPVEIRAQIPLYPPFSKGEFLRGILKPLFGKEGKGRFWEEWWENCATNLSGRTLNLGIALTAVLFLSSCSTTGVNPTGLMGGQIMCPTGPRPTL